MIGALIGAGASLIGGMMQKGAAEDAADAQVRAAAQATDEQRRQYGETRKDLAPWREAGTDAIRTLNALVTGKDPELMRGFDYQADPGYAFRLAEGQKGIQNAAAARGGQISGAGMKGLTRWNQDYASNEYQNSWNRDDAERKRKYNMLSGVAGSGQMATNTLVGAGTGMANRVSEYGLQAGNARAAGMMGGANALAGGLTNAASGIGDYMNLQSILKSPNNSGRGYLASGQLNRMRV